MRGARRKKKNKTLECPKCPKQPSHREGWIGFRRLADLSRLAKRQFWGREWTVYNSVVYGACLCPGESDLSCYGLHISAKTPTKDTQQYSWIFRTLIYLLSCMFCPHHLSLFGLKLTVFATMLMALILACNIRIQWEHKPSPFHSCCFSFLKSDYTAQNRM